MKRLTALATAAVLTASSAALGDYPPSASSPPGYPPTAQAAAVQPAQPTAPQPARPAPRVQVFPFEPVGNPGQVDWVGKGLQESLQTDVSHTGAILVMAASVLPPNTTPVEAAKASGANLAVVGTYQVQGDSVRADGHLIDVATGQPVGGFSGKAPIGSVFQLEDAMGAQLQRLLPLDRSMAAVAGSYNYNGVPADQPVVVNEAPPVTDAEPTTINNTYVSPGTTYAYPDSFDSGYGYGYPDTGYYGAYDPFLFGFYGGIGIYPGYYGGYRGGYRGYGHGYGDHGHDYGHGYGYGGGYRSTTTFRGSTFGGGRSFSSVGHAGFGGGGFHGGASFGGGFHGGGGGGHR